MTQTSAARVSRPASPPVSASPALRALRRRGGARGLLGRAASLFFALIWFVVVAAPIYFMLVVSLLRTDSFLSSNPWFPSTGLTLHNYANVLESGFPRYLLNSVIVSVGATALAVGVSIFAAYAIVIRASRVTGFVFRAFLTGFAVPIQALMIPLYLEIAQLGLYDSMLGLILPMAAFSLPITVLILVNFLREVPHSLVQAMELDGAGPVRILRSLALPISMPAVVTVAIFDFINAWNNFLFPLILTQGSDSATLPLAVFEFQGNRFADVPAIMACVALSILPLFVLYLVARRQITTALAAGFGS